MSSESQSRRSKVHCGRPFDSVGPGRFRATLLPRTTCIVPDVLGGLVRGVVTHFTDNKTKLSHDGRPGTLFKFRTLNLNVLFNLISLGPQRSESHEYHVSLLSLFLLYRD